MWKFNSCFYSQSKLQLELDLWDGGSWATPCAHCTHQYTICAQHFICAHCTPIHQCTLHMCTTAHHIAHHTAILHTAHRTCTHHTSAKLHMCTLQNSTSVCYFTAQHNKCLWLSDFSSYNNMLQHTTPAICCNTSVQCKNLPHIHVHTNTHTPIQQCHISTTHLWTT